MVIRLNSRSFRYARKLIDDGRFVLDERDAWSEHRPTAEQANEFMDEFGIGDYQRWFLGIDDEAPEGSRERFTFPCGDFVDVHRCAVLSAEVRAAQYKHFGIEVAAAHLHGLMDAHRGDGRRGRT